MFVLVLELSLSLLLLLLLFGSVIVVIVIAIVVSIKHNPSITLLQLLSIDFSDFRLLSRMQLNILVITLPNLWSVLNLHQCKLVTFLLLYWLLHLLP